MNKRIGLLLTLAAVIAAVMALSAVGASAQPTCTDQKNVPENGQTTRTCEETVVTTETQTTNTTQPCEVGNSGRQGVQAGTLTETFEVTTTTTTTTVFQGNPNSGKVVSGPTTEEQTTREPISSEFTPTGPCKNIPGPKPSRPNILHHIRANLEASLTGEKEVPGPGDPNGRGHADVKVYKAKVCYELGVKRIKPATAAHIHQGRPGEAGPIVVELKAPTDGSSEGCKAISKKLSKKLRDNPSHYYVNVHNRPYPDGAIRGQLHRD